MSHLLTSSRITGSVRDYYARVLRSSEEIEVDMTEPELAVARKHETWHAHGFGHAFGYAEPNTRLVQGYIEDLAADGVADESVDLVISNRSSTSRRTSHESSARSFG